MSGSEKEKEPGKNTVSQEQQINRGSVRFSETTAVDGQQQITIGNIENEQSEKNIECAHYFCRDVCLDANKGKHGNSDFHHRKPARNKYQQIKTDEFPFKKNFQDVTDSRRGEFADPRPKEEDGGNVIGDNDQGGYNLKVPQFNTIQAT